MCFTSLKVIKLSSNLFSTLLCKKLYFWVHFIIPKLCKTLIHINCYHGNNIWHILMLSYGDRIEIPTHTYQIHNSHQTFFLDGWINVLYIWHHGQVLCVIMLILSYILSYVVHATIMAHWIFFIIDTIIRNLWAANACKIQVGSVPNLINCGNNFIYFVHLLW